MGRAVVGCPRAGCGVLALASSRFLSPPLSEDRFGRQAIEILLDAPAPQTDSPRMVRRLAIVGPAPSASEFSAELLFSRLSAHFQERFSAALSRVANAAALTLRKQPFFAPNPDAAVLGGSGSVWVVFGPRADDPAASASARERAAIWRARWDHVQSVIEHEALPEWILLHFLSEGARLVAARDEQGPSAAVASRPSDFLSSSAIAQFAARERERILLESGLPAEPREGDRARSAEPRRL